MIINKRWVINNRWVFLFDIDRPVDIGLTDEGWEWVKSICMSPDNNIHPVFPDSDRGSQHGTRRLVSGGGDYSAGHLSRSIIC